MKNQDKWTPTKYAEHRGRLRASRDPKHLQVASRLITDRVAACYDSVFKQHVRGDLLDLGCGQAPFYGAYKDYATTVTCVDWPGSPHDVQYADVLCDVNQSLPIPGASFDTVLCSDVIEHLHSPQVLIGEISRVLRPGGKVLINAPFMYGLHEQPHDYHRYTKYALAHMSEMHGLRVLEIRELGGAGDVACDLFAKVAVGVPLVGNMVASLAQASWDLAKCIPFIRRMDQRTAEYFPLEYFALLTQSNSEPAAAGATN